MGMIGVAYIRKGLPGTRISTPASESRRPNLPKKPNTKFNLFQYPNHWSITKLKL